MPHAFKFFLAGGFDQVRIDTAADLLNLKDLDQKLWVALSCPTTGIEFDARTLALIDTDNDGHIRAPELLAAIDWAAARLNDSSVFEKKLAGVPLAAIQDEAVLAAARGLLPEGEALVSVDAASAAEAEYSARALAAWEAAGADAKPLGDARLRVDRHDPEFLLLCTRSLVEFVSERVHPAERARPVRLQILSALPPHPLEWLRL